VPIFGQCFIIIIQYAYSYLLDIYNLNLVNCTRVREVT